MFYKAKHNIEELNLKEKIHPKSDRAKNFGKTSIDSANSDSEVILS